MLFSKAVFISERRFSSPYAKCTTSDFGFDDAVEQTKNNTKLLWNSFGVSLDAVHFR